MSKYKMQIEIRKTSELKFYPDNPRMATKAIIEQVKNSIEAFGMVEPLVVNPDGFVIGGNQRLRALLVLKVEEIQCVIVDLPIEQEKALNLALNKVQGDWDVELLPKFIEEMEEESLLLAGFKEDEIKALRHIEEEEIKGEEDDFDPDTAPAVCQKGDLWKLGKHRLICGDSTHAETIARLMNGRQADIVITDPPYNVDYTGKTKDALKIQNDKRDKNEFYTFLLDAFKNMVENTKEGCPAYICFGDGSAREFICSFQDAGWDYKQLIIWNKNSMVMGRRDYHYKHEPIMYGWKPGAPHKWYGGRNKVTVWDIDRPQRSTEHPTMKPVELISTALRNSSKENDLILDIFAGSGTTAISAERMGRACYMCELDPKYCDVIIARWEKLTGQEAIKEEAGDLERGTHA